MSVAVAENSLLPALRDAPADSIYVADGYSCRTQANDLTDVQGVTLAQLLTGMELGPEHSARAQRLPDAGIAQSARVGDAGNGAQAGAETAARAAQPVSVSIG